jgi:C1A family cysteine protease
MPHRSHDALRTSHSAKDRVAFVLLVLLVTFTCVNIVAPNGSTATKNNTPSVNRTEQNTNSTSIIAQQQNFVVVQNGVKYLAENFTREKVEQMKRQIGVRDPNKNYNVLVDGKGTGLAPPTEEEWNSMVGQTVIDGVIRNGSAQSGSPSSVDLSQQTYFPPVGDQGQQGSCTGWAMTYYAYGYLEAKDNGWNAKSGNSQYLLSPAWTYNKVNWGHDDGSSTGSDAQVIMDWGTATLSTMPYNQGDYTSWGNENAWREAPLHRAQSVHSISYTGDPTVDTVRTLVASGIPVTFSIDANQLPTYKTEPDGNFIFSAAEYSSTTTNHAQTIVGYDNSVGEGSDVGSFKVVNSWGSSWGLSGFYWLTYNAFKEIGSLLDLCYITDRSGYVPQLLATWRFSSSPTRDADITVGLGSYASPVMQETPFYAHNAPGYTLTFPAFMVLDITDFLPDYNSSYFDFFLSIGIATTSGTISSFRIEKHNPYWYCAGYPSQTSPESVDVPKSTPGYVTTALPVVYDIVAHASIYVQPLGYYAYPWTLSTGNGIYGNFTVQDTGKTMEWLLLDSTNFAKFQNSQPYTALLSASSVHSYSWQYQVSACDTYYIVYWVRYDFLFGRTVELWQCQDLTPPIFVAHWGPNSSNEPPTALGSHIRLGFLSATDNKFGVAYTRVDVFNPGSNTVFSYASASSTFETEWVVSSSGPTGAYKVRFSTADICGNLAQYDAIVNIVALKYPTTNLRTIAAYGYTSNSCYVSVTGVDGYDTRLEVSVSTGEGNCYIMDAGNFSNYQLSLPYTPIVNKTGGVGTNNWDLGVALNKSGTYYLVVEEPYGQELDVCYSSWHAHNEKQILVAHDLSSTIQPSQWAEYKVISAPSGYMFKDGDMFKVVIVNRSMDFGWYMDVHGNWAEGCKYGEYVNGVLYGVFWVNETATVEPPFVVPNSTAFWSTWESISPFDFTKGTSNMTMSYSSSSYQTEAVYSLSTGVMLRYYYRTSSGVVEYVLRHTNIANALPTLRVDHPSDISFIEGASGHKIVWSPSSEQPVKYDIYKNGTIIDSGNWNGSSISWSLDNLAVGTYNFTLVVFDYYEQEATDTVMVTVQSTAGQSVGVSPVVLVILGIAGAAAAVTVVAIIKIKMPKKGRR